MGLRLIIIIVFIQLTTIQVETTAVAAMVAGRQRIQEAAAGMRRLPPHRKRRQRKRPQMNLRQRYRGGGEKKLHRVSFYRYFL